MTIESEELTTTEEFQAALSVLDDGLGKCNICHRNAGANATVGGQDIGNANFDTGVENLPDQPQDLTGERVPPDDGFGTPGDGTFNTPPLVEAADTGPFFHNNSIETIEGAVAFYDGESFNNSPSGLFLAGIDPNGVGIELDATQVVAVAAFLRVINALENIRESIGLLNRRTSASLQRAEFETEDAIDVLRGAGLHPNAITHLVEAKRLARKAARSYFFNRKLAREAIVALEKARSELIDKS